MSEKPQVSKDVLKKAFQEAEKEHIQKQIERVKVMILDTLEKLEAQRYEKALVEEKIRILKLDLEDLKNGNFDKIAERQKKSKAAKQISVPMPVDLIGWGTGGWTYVPASTTTYTGQPTTGYAGTAAYLNATGGVSINWVQKTSDTYVTHSGKTYYV